MSAFLNVGRLRVALADLPDEAEIALTSVQGGDHGITEVNATMLIPWGHDCTDAPETHKPGRDCPIALACELLTTTPDGPDA